ncbi:hypothetical protein SEA_IBANTIK_51 [Streptomyces phage Ibantik]|uniref:Uncharacterized protein n=1 Tax=Streptomyces phage Ibantik TaxID=2182397 RepID=A0A2U8UNM6_9CAUD|nr:hypothetical protein QEH36_gp051 [Streptomyces phage Ibantik]AWN05275.1 hypothetical protein SEA_IBANTIK_51 [Streptomyces phage Ibantik]
MIPCIILTAVLCLSVGFTLGMVAKPAESNPLKESRNA